MKNFVELTDKEYDMPVYIKKEDISSIVPLTDDALHRHEHNYKKDMYDNTKIFSGIATKYGIVHVKETPEEIANIIKFKYFLIEKELRRLENRVELRDVTQWHEDLKDCIWWKETQLQYGIPVEPPVYIGSPLCSDWKDEYKYFVEITCLNKGEFR